LKSERRFFFLSQKKTSKKKSGKKIQNLRAGAFTNARAGRERKRRATDFRTNRTFYSLAVRFVFVFRVRGEGEEETRAREREREIKKVTTKFFSSVRAQKRDRATKPKKERTRT